MKKRLLGLFATLALLITCVAFSAGAESSTVSPWDAAAPTPFDGSVCPHCVAHGKSGTNITWEEWTPGTFASGKHYKISSSYQLTSYYNCGVECVIWIQDNVTLTAKNGSNALRVNSANSELWLLGGRNARITGTGAAATKSNNGDPAGRTTTNGGLLRVIGNAAAEMHIGGDLTISLLNPVTTGMGGLVDVYLGTLYMHDGTLLGVENSASGIADANGNAAISYGAVISRNTGNFVMEGGRIKGGSSTQPAPIYMEKGTVTIRGDAYVEAAAGEISGDGGAIYVNNGTLNINGGTITGGYAAKGGALYLGASAKVNMTTGTINGPKITDSTTTVIKGGAIYSVATGTTAVQLNGGTINGGTIARKANTSKNITALKGQGGAIYLDGGVVNLGGVNIVGGKAQDGGCVYVNKGTLNMTSGTMSMGDSLSNGGTVFLKGTMNMSGGTVTVNPDCTYAYSRGIRIVNGTLNLSGNAHVISDGTAEGNGVYAVTTNSSSLAKVTLDGNAKVTNPDGTYVSNNIFVSNWGDNDSTRYPAKIEVKKGFTGAASVKFAYIYSTEYSNPGAVYSVGMTIDSNFASADGDFTGELRMETAAGNPNLWWDGATGLKASDVQICKKVDGLHVTTWAKSNNAAVAAYNGGYIKLLNSDPIDLQGKEVYVDFNGNASQVTLSGGKLYGLDNTATAASAGKSVITVKDGTPELYARNPVTGQHIMTLPGDAGYSFHTVDAGIRSVSLRPSTAGIYYSAAFECDELLKPYIESFGVAVSLDHLPGADFATDSKVLYTVTDKAALGAGTFNSVLVNAIMKDQAAATNKANAELPIYAAAYMKLSVDGQSYTLMAEDTAQLSLKNVMQQIDKLWNGLDQTARESVISNIYDPYIAEFAVNDWNLQNIEAGELDPDRELKVLTIGNSLSVDAGRMLAYVAQQEGSVAFKVGTLYKANCSVQEHADFLINDKPNYWYYESSFDANSDADLVAGSLVPSETKSFVGDDALEAEQWDVIIMQHSVFGSARPDTYDESIDTIIEHVRQSNPNAVLVWNMTWMAPVDDELLAIAEEGGSPGFSKSYSNYTKDPLDREAQTMMYEMIAGAVKEKIHTDDRFAYILPSATMMQNALTATSDKVMYRDYIHGSDYGRLMNAYLWYSMLTGKTITEPVVTVVPGALRQATANQSEDLTLTQRMQDILVESVNNAMRNPFETTVSQYQKEESLKVLAIGNSFSQDAMWHLEEIARSEGYTDVKLGTLYIGGSSLSQNWTKASGNLADYQYYYNYDGNWKNSGAYNTSISQALAEQDWDIVTLQQSSGNSGKADTYEPYLENLVNYVQTNAPKAKIVWHMTWAYSQDSTHSSFPDYDSDQITMYGAIVDATKSKVVPYVTAGDIASIIPCGTAIQNARNSYVGDEFDRDGYHLNLMGRIVAAATWYSVLTDEPLEEMSAFYFNDHFMSGKPRVTLTDRDRQMIVTAVNCAIENPWQAIGFAS